MLNQDFTKGGEGLALKVKICPQFTDGSLEEKLSTTGRFCNFSKLTLIPPFRFGTFLELFESQV